MVVEEVMVRCSLEFCFYFVVCKNRESSLYVEEEEIDPVAQCVLEDKQVFALFYLFSVSCVFCCCYCCHRREA